MMQYSVELKSCLAWHDCVRIVGYKTLAARQYSDFSKLIEHSSKKQLISEICKETQIFNDMAIFIRKIMDVHEIRFVYHERKVELVTMDRTYIITASERLLDILENAQELEY